MTKRIGFIGKANITEYEQNILILLGRYIAAMGHTVVLVPAKGAATALREGVERQGGKISLQKEGTIEAADHTHVYADSFLLARLKQKYPDIEDRTDVLIIKPTQLDEWHDAVKTVMQERNLSI